jgi:hypothetical protein
MSTDSNWGGSREGAGRPSLSDEDTVRKTVTIPESVAEYLEEVGGGNASAGVRKLAEAAMDHESLTRT